ncbi:MAG: hypothetical protein LAN59_02285 [Acidobacteriia bacterium]|nr:hypothetical protein [Terriglobia bacterium]
MATTLQTTPETAPAPPSRHATDDEILGLASAAPRTSPMGASRKARGTAPDVTAEADSGHGSAVPLQQGDEVAPTSGEESRDVPAEPEQLRAAFEAHPELRRAWDEAEAYRETFATPDEARAATALLADLDRMDALFFSRRPEDHAELARAVAGLDPEAFASLAQAMNGLATEAQRHRGNNAARQGSTEAGNDGAAAASGAANAADAVGASRGPRGTVPASDPQSRTANPPDVIPRSGATRNPSSAAHDTEPAQEREIPRDARDDTARNVSGVTPAQAEFFHAANAAAVQGVLEAIETQVERLLPEGISTSAHQRVVREIYRELDASLQSNRQLAQQMREAFRSGALDAAHQRAVVSLLTGRAKQALPGVAKRVLGEWTSTIVAASHDRRARQRAAERRVDIAGSGGAANDGRRSIAPRDLDYARLSDADILNL